MDIKISELRQERKTDLSIISFFISRPWPIQWVQEPLFPGVKQLQLEDDHSPPSGVEVMGGGAIPAFPIRLLGLVRNYE
jgi:hypothetical protein